MDMNSIRTVSVLKSMTIVLSMFGSMQTKKLTLMKSKAVKRSVSVVTRVTTLTVTTNVSNSQKTAKRLTNTENVLNAAKVSSSRVTNVLLTIIVKNTDGLIPETDGTVPKLKAVKRSVNVVKRVTTSTVTTNVLNSQIIVKKLTNMENALNAAKAIN